MPGQYGQRTPKLPTGARINAREDNPDIRTTAAEQFSAEFVATGLLALRNSLADLARLTENRAHPVDEYNTTPITGAATESTLSVPPTYEYMPEKIESIVVTGPAGSQLTLVLGDRQWPVIIPVSGILTIGPLAVILGRTDPRMLVAQTPGQYTFELMGIADKRFKI